jgi:succinoglycan biosynthesis transport protein ExoP
MGEISEALRRARTGEATAPAGSASERVPLPPPPAPLAQSAPNAPEPQPADRIESPPRTREGLWSPRALFVEDHGAAAECARHLALRVRGELERRKARIVAIVSALHDEGKTTVAGNLAMALCSLSSTRSIAIVDLDLRRPSLAKTLGVAPQRGIDDVIAGDASLVEACVSFEHPVLDAYPVRKARGSAHELLVKPALVNVLAELERRYEVVVIDTPPVLLVPDTGILLELVPACVAVARAGRSRSHAFQRMCAVLPAGKLIGAVLDEGRLPTDAASYRYYEE